MKFNALDMQGAFMIETERLEDERGFFARTYCRREFIRFGLNPDIAQCNISYNVSRGTLRGMHYQYPRGEAKLVRCSKGAIHDVIIDLRPDSPTFKKHFGVRLSERNRKMLFVPEGFAHGFLTLEDDSEIFYQMSEFYIADKAHGVRWNDPAFAIEWPESIRVISDRDNSYPDFPS